MVLESFMLVILVLFYLVKLVKIQFFCLEWLKLNISSQKSLFSRHFFEKKINISLPHTLDLKFIQWDQV